MNKHRRVINYLNGNMRMQKGIREELIPKIISASEIIIEAIENKRKLFFFGNGGSAGDAQHFAAEFIGRFEKERKAFPAIALTTDTSILTAVANDYDYNQIFVRQLDGLGKKGDVAIGITTSGNSKNVIKAIYKAHAMKMDTIVLTGKDGGDIIKRLNFACNCIITVPSNRTSHIQEGHEIIGHIISSIVEEALT